MKSSKLRDVVLSIKQQKKGPKSPLKVFLINNLNKNRLVLLLFFFFSSFLERERQTATVSQSERINHRHSEWLSERDTHVLYITDRPLMMAHTHALLFQWLHSTFAFFLSFSQGSSFFSFFPFSPQWQWWDKKGRQVHTLSTALQRT